MCHEDPPPCNSGITGIQEDPDIILTLPYSHYYRGGGPPNVCVMNLRLDLDVADSALKLRLENVGVS